jgi:hypothetical protein
VIANCKIVEEISSRPRFFFWGRGVISVYSSTEQTFPKDQGLFVAARTLPVRVLARQSDGKVTFTG